LHAYGYKVKAADKFFKKQSTPLLKKAKYTVFGAIQKYLRKHPLSLFP
jgi:hypothetical protein